MVVQGSSLSLRTTRWWPRQPPATCSRSRPSPARSSATVAGAAAKPSWQTIPVGVDQRGVFFAAGRAWYYSGIESGNFRTKSARVASGRLCRVDDGDARRLARLGLIGPHGQELVSRRRTRRPAGREAPPHGPLRWATGLRHRRSSGRLLDGLQRDPAARSRDSACELLRLPGAPGEEVSQLRGPHGRVLRRQRRRRGLRLVRQAQLLRASAARPRSRGRLWLAWKGPRPEHPRRWSSSIPRRSSRAASRPRLPARTRIVKTVALVCSDVCRLVVQASKRGPRQPDRTRTTRGLRANGRSRRSSCLAPVSSSSPPAPARAVSSSRSPPPR